MSELVQVDRDGRNLDPLLADQRGEGAAIEVRIPDIGWPISPDAHLHAEHAPSHTYYDLPVVKVPTWKGFIPTYFHLGGLAGAASSLAGVLQLTRSPRHAVLERRLHWISLIAEGVGAACLIADLGRPARFYNMMRVFRPTSPMNMGTWILSAAGTTSGLTVLDSLLHPRRAPRPSFVGIANAIAGTMLSTYTGVLLGNTVVPVWKHTRNRLPLWFAALSAASLGSLLEITGERTPAVRVYSAVAKLGAVATGHAITRAANRHGVGAPLRDGRSGTLMRLSTWLGVASLAATILPWGGRKREVIAGVLGTAAAFTARHAIVRAGRASAADPRATFEPQRRAMAANARSGLDNSRGEPYERVPRVDDTSVTATSVHRARDY